jgi:hypothetical protein
LKYLILLLSVFLLNTTSATAADKVLLRPADFNHEESKKRLVTRIEFPEMKNNAGVMVHCFSQITSGGKMNDTGCFSASSQEIPFAAAVMKAANKASMTPAVIDGKRRKVYVQFRVEFIAKDDDRRIYVYANPGNAENIEAYGYDHIAPQRTIGDETWQKICPKRASYMLLARAFVGEDGQASHPSLEYVNGITPTIDCQNAIKQTIVQSLFTPGMDDGVPVPSAFVESFGN